MTVNWQRVREYQDIIYNNAAHLKGQRSEMTALAGSTPGH